MLGPHAIHGVVLAGGRGTRMGGVDKGLQPHRGRPLALHAAERLATQVASLSISANRHLDVYRGFGWAVWPDDPPGDRGPLDGLATALGHSTRPWLAAVPCDSPRLPLDLVARLSTAIEAMENAADEGADAAVAVTRDPDGTRRVHPTVCLLRTSLHDDLRAWLAAGERRVGAWLRRHRLVEVAFDDAGVFSNLNTLADLQAEDAAIVSASRGEAHAATCPQDPPWPST